MPGIDTGGYSDEEPQMPGIDTGGYSDEEPQMPGRDTGGYSDEEPQQCLEEIQEVTQMKSLSNARKRYRRLLR